MRSEPDLDDPVAAFDQLRREVSLCVRAIEGLTAERQNMPDYSETLRAMDVRLYNAGRTLEAMAKMPAMELTPENLAARIAKASEAAREGDCHALGRAGAVLQSSIASINDVVEHAWAADRQWKQLYYVGAGAFLLGATGAVSIMHVIG
jgi:hypothetical protein